MSRRRAPQATPEQAARFLRGPTAQRGWSEWAALGFVAVRPMGHRALGEGWLVPLVDFVRENRRLPDGRERPRLMRTGEARMAGFVRAQAVTKTDGGEAA